ncbi:type II secretion system protein GspK, partial [Pirellulales bacterium]|nr:type II secretion system protein GspK [Pirellulales bacterium]
RRGSVLLLVLVVVAALALSTQTYLELMQNEQQAVRFHGRRAQTTRLAESGVDYLKALLALPDEEIESVGGINDNPAELQAVVVEDRPKPTEAGRFTIFAASADPGAGSTWRYGLENESAKLNVNSLIQETDPMAGRRRLMALPGMETEIADAILDWLDDDDFPREFGAEGSYYAAQTPSYEPRNGPIRDLDELLVVRGVTRELLFGDDANRNYQIDAGEVAPDGGSSRDDEGNIRGWSAYLSAVSSERLGGASVDAPVNVNGTNLRTVHQDLSAALGTPEADFIVLFRQYGGAQANGSQDGSQDGQQDGEQGEQPSQRQSEAQNIAQRGEESKDAATIDFDKPGETQIESLLDLVGAQVTIPADEESGAEAQTVSSPWPNAGTSSREILDLYDLAALGEDARVAGRININLAPRPVLRSLPDVAPDLAEQIISRRDPLATTHRHAVWLLIEGIVDQKTMKSLEPYVTAGGRVYRGQVIGFFAGGGPVARLEVCLDCTGPRPRIVEWRDRTSQPLGMTREAIGMGD